MPSIKGALRFWWRSLMWGSVPSHEELLKQEEWIFGSSDAKAGQTKVRPRFARRKLAPQVPLGESFERGRLKGAHYLGYGVMDYNGQLSRAMLPGGEFDIELSLSRLLNDEQIRQVSNALVLLGTVGGLGSKFARAYLTEQEGCRD